MKFQGLTNSDKDFIREYVAEAQSDEEKQARRREVAESFGVSLPTIAAITAWTKIRANKAGTPDENAASALQEATAENPVAADPMPSFPETAQPVLYISEISTIDAPPAEIQIVSEGGEHFDYDNEVKRAWRKKLQEFIAGHTDPKERAKMRVLCLPGKKCLEIPVYTELGFNPNLIVGVEGGDAEARAEFQANAKKMRIQTRIGRLEDIVGSEKKPFDVVSLDLLGPSSKGFVQILRNLLLSDTSLLMVNSMSKREQSLIGDYYRQMNNRAHSLVSLNPDSGFEGFIKALLPTTDPPTKVKGSRDLGLRWLIMENLGRDRHETHLFQRERDHLAQLSGFPLHTLQFLIPQLGAVELIDKSLERFLLAQGYPYEVSSGTSYLAGLLLLSAVLEEKFLFEYKKYKYCSRSGKSSTPFITDLCLFKSGRTCLHETRETVAFLISILAYFLDRDGDARQNWCGWEFTDKRGTTITHKPTKFDFIIARTHNGTVLGRLKFDVFSRDLKRFNMFQAGRPMPVELLAVEREEIIPTSDHVDDSFSEKDSAAHIHKDQDDSISLGRFGANILSILDSKS